MEYSTKIAIIILTILFLISGFFITSNFSTIDSNCFYEPIVNEFGDQIQSYDELREEFNLNFADKTFEENKIVKVNGVIQQYSCFEVLE